MMVAGALQHCECCRYVGLLKEKFHSKTPGRIIVFGYANKTHIALIIFISS
jgi:hypothetical protein